VIHTAFCSGNTFLLFDHNTSNHRFVLSVQSLGGRASAGLLRGCIFMAPTSFAGRKIHRIRRNGIVFFYVSLHSHFFQGLE
jgi:hypothetical protein